MRREFPRKVMAAAFERAAGRCENCAAWLTVGKFHYDHIIADSIGGEPTLSNCAVLCHPCHGAKTAQIDTPRAAKTKRQRDRHIGASRPKGNWGAGKNTNWKQLIGGRTVPR
jgi:5-methylcytosine-specific restriction protein A